LLYERARTELAATGARPRRELLLSGPESLTRSEAPRASWPRRDTPTRDLPGLFVTPKTVEYHLRNVYHMLEIETRRELAGALVA